MASNARQKKARRQFLLALLFLFVCLIMMGNVDVEKSNKHAIRIKRRVFSEHQAITANSSVLEEYLLEQDPISEDESDIFGLELEAKSPNKHDVSIIITSSLVKTHPRIDMISDTIHSLHTYLLGLPHDVPIIITLDGLMETSRNENNIRRYDEYIHILKNSTFHPLTNIQVMEPLTENGLLTNQIRNALEIVETDFIYIIQHDLAFCGHVNHTTLIQSMKEHPKELYNVRFLLNGHFRRTFKGRCYLHKSKTGEMVADYPPEEYNGLNVYASNWFSDNNHISTKAYYTRLLNTFFAVGSESEVGYMEHIMKHISKRNCTEWGQQMYGRRGVTDFKLCHLDGRRNNQYTSRYNHTTKEWIWTR